MIDKGVIIHVVLKVDAITIFLPVELVEWYWDCLVPIYEEVMIA